ncbi:MAG: hypothetical protein ACE5OZ_15020 [Candidatus Heimdallarchaeota archaeon]
MDVEASFRLNLKIYGTVLLGASLAHAIWHWFFPSYSELDGLTETQWNLLYMLNWGVALFLLLLSLISFGLSFAKSCSVFQMRIFSGLMIGFWICRLTLEVLFPVQIPFLIIQNPSLLIIILLVVVITILAIPELHFQLRRS